MNTTDYAGIDYGHGRTNVDPATGIRYGVINMNALIEWAWESMEGDYGEPSCPECGGSVKTPEEADGNIDDYVPGRKHGCCADYVCESCGIYLNSDMATDDDPVGYVLDSDGYEGWVGGDGDLMLTASLYYTHAQFCSPCVPGAGHLEQPCDGGPKTYALSHDWFEDDEAPYPVYEVATGRQIAPPAK